MSANERIVVVIEGIPGALTKSLKLLEQQGVLAVILQFQDTPQSDIYEVVFSDTAAAMLGSDFEVIEERIAALLEGHDFEPQHQLLGAMYGTIHPVYKQLRLVLTYDQTVEPDVIVRTVQYLFVA